tara:strand:- start:4055 stop:5248 length:1194 start_codon:yes stop_codon:yes gene_type:complete
MAKASIYFLLLCAYNPYTTFGFNQTGFFGGAFHQVLLALGVLAFFAAHPIKSFSTATYGELLWLLFLLIFCAFGALGARSDASFNLILSDMAFVVEYYLFYTIGTRLPLVMSLVDAFLVYYRVLFLNAVALIMLWVSFPLEFYFRLDFGGIYVPRAVDFVVPSLLLALMTSSSSIHKSKLTRNLGWIVAIVAVLIGFSRGVWLALAFVFFLYLMIGSSDRMAKVSGQKIFQVSVFTCLLFMGLYSSGVLDFVFQRLSINNAEESSFLGRISAYFGLLEATLSDLKVFVFGNGMGSYMPTKPVPVSSSPSLFLGFLFMNGIFLFSVFLFVLFYPLICFYLKYKKENDEFALYAMLLFVCQIVMLNIFPSVSHYPILGFMGLIAGMTLSRHRGKLVKQN